MKGNINSLIHSINDKLNKDNLDAFSELSISLVGIKSILKEILEGLKMTKQEFKNARINNTIQFIRKLELELEAITGKNKISNTKRLIEKANKYLKQYQTDFWNDDNNNIYEMLYKNNENMTYKDVSIW